MTFGKIAKTLRTALKYIIIFISFYVAFAHYALASFLNCGITNFDAHFALSNLFNEARSTAVENTGRSSISGQLERCDPSRHDFCWYYRQKCGGADIFVEVSPHGQPVFFLLFEDPTIGQCVIDGGFGRIIGGVCVAPDWSREPRRLEESMNKWIKVRVEPSNTHETLSFNATSVTIGGSNPIQFWYKKLDGIWWVLPRLDPGTHNLVSLVNGVTDIWISGAVGTSSGNFVLESINIIR